LATVVNIDEFLKLSEVHPVIDVRTPVEFEHGHIPDAFNLPLFSNEERVIIGTLYKQKGKQPAVLRGLEIVGPKLHEYVNSAIPINKTGTFLVHCWRGGMRSSSMAWFLETYGFNCILLKGGYKSYRNYVLDSFSAPKNIVVLGGRTGTGKTKILHELERLNEQVIDLEKLAHHKGSTFGALGEEPQPTQEQFENNLSSCYTKISPQEKCWVENESRKVGRDIIPLGIWDQMQNAKVVTIGLPVDERIKFLVNEYGKFPKEELITATERIGRHLGGQHVKAAVEALQNDDCKTAFEICLVYYDKTYGYGLSKRPKENIIQCDFEKLDPVEIAKAIKEFNTEKQS
jgi:tRNA 2-selenouridine synthase